MTKAPKRSRWRSLTAGLLIFLFGAPLFNLGILSLYKNQESVRGGFSASDGWVALGLGLLILGLSFWLLFAQVKLDAYSGWQRRLQFLEYGSFVVISLGLGFGMTPYPGDWSGRIYTVILLTGLILGLIFIVGRSALGIHELRKKS